MTGTLFDQPWLRAVGPDFLALAVSALMIAAYYFYLRFRVRQDPTYSIHVVNEAARRLWVQHVMANPSRDVMAVQTLRNFIMVGILMVSTATLLIIGTLTLSSQAPDGANSPPPRTRCRASAEHVEPQLKFRAVPSLPRER